MYIHTYGGGGEHLSQKRGQGLTERDTVQNSIVRYTLCVYIHIEKGERRGREERGVGRRKEERGERRGGRGEGESRVREEEWIHIFRVG